MRIRAQFAIQLFGGIANILLLLVSTPVLIHTIGLERYGILLLILSFIVYIGIADLGVGAATSQRIASSRKDGQCSVFSTALAISALLGIMAGILFALLSLPAVGLVMGLTPKVAGELAAGWSGLFLLGFGTILAGPPQGALLGLSRFVELNISNFVGSAAAILGPVVYVLWFGTGLSGLLLSAALGRLAAAAIAFAACLKAGLSVHVLAVQKRTALQLLDYGTWQTISGLLHRVTSSIDRPLLGFFCGVGVIPFFAVPQAMLTRANVFAPALMSALFPRIASMDTVECRKAIAETSYRAICLLTPLYVIGIIIMPNFLEIWIGANFSRWSSGTAVLLAIAAWLDLIGYVPYVVMQATAQMKREARIGGLIAIPNLISLSIAVYYWGAVGAGVVAVLRSLSFLVARVLATGRSAFPLVDICLNISAISFAALLFLIGCHGWVAVGGALTASIYALAITYFRRPAFVTQVIPRVLRAL